MRTTQRLYEAAHPIWEQCHDHPFVRGIGDGSLDLEKFQWFLLQDYLYLFDYARVFAYGVVKARDPGLMRTFSANVDAILGGEMKVHRAYMAGWASRRSRCFLSSRPSPICPIPTTCSPVPPRAGRRRSSPPSSLAPGAMRRSARAWRPSPGAADHPLLRRVDPQLRGEDYQKTNDALVELMDTLAESCTEAEYQRLEEIFHQLRRYELGFWEMAWTLER